MRIVLGGVMGAGARRRGEPAFALVTEYLKRASQHMPCSFEDFADEGSLLETLTRRAGRTAPVLWIFDRGGLEVSSEEFAERVRRMRDGGRQELVVAVGPASGWSTAARSRADGVFSLGKMTLPHGLAQAVVAEQVYRAMTILANHPYHCGH